MEFSDLTLQQNFEKTDFDFVLRFMVIFSFLLSVSRLMPNSASFLCKEYLLEIRTKRA